MTPRVIAPPFRVSHVLFDIDGTLVNYRSAVRAAFAAAAARCTVITGRAVTGEDIRTTRAQLTAEPSWQRRTPTEQRRETMWRMLAERGANPGAAMDAALDTVLHAYQDARDRAITVFPDVVETLEALRARGLTLVAASNGDVDLGRVGIGAQITATHYAADVGVAKPDPRFFALALERFGVEPGRAVVVGDRVDNDYAPAIAVGVAAVVIDRDARVTDAAVLRIGALTELPGLIEAV